MYEFRVKNTKYFENVSYLTTKADKETFDVQVREISFGFGRYHNALKQPVPIENGRGKFDAKIPNEARGLPMNNSITKLRSSSVPPRPAY